MDKNLIDFFLKTGEVKRMKQRGLVLRGMKDPVTIGSHSFREAIMGWTIIRTNNSGLDTSRVIKITLVHDLVAGYAGDITPYDPLLKKNGEKSLKEMYKKWIRLSKKKKEYFHKLQRTREQKTLQELTKNLPKAFTTEMKNLWMEYEKGLTAEGRFVQQIDMLENFLQALEYWKKDKKFPIEPWWQQMKELISDPFLEKLLVEIDKEFHQKKR